MSENIVRQVRQIEQEADRLVAEARHEARRLQDGLEGEIASLRGEHEAELKRELDGFKQDLGEHTDEQLEELDKKAQQAARRLESLDEEAMRRARELIISHLRGDARCP